MKKARSFGLIDLMMLGLVVVWGANYAIVKSALAQLSPLAFNALRFTGAAVVILFLTWVVERDLSVRRSDWGGLLMLGFLGSFLYQNVFIQGMARTRASNSSLILSTTPIFVALIGTLLGTEHLERRNWLGIIISCAGILLLIGGGSALSVGRETLVGDVLVLAGTAIWATYTIVAKGVMDRNSVLKVTAWMMASMAPLLVLVALPDLRQQDWRAVSGQSWLGLAYSAVLAIGIGYAAWNTGVKRLGSARTSVYSYLTPLFAVLASWVLLGEHMNALQALGAGGILLGVWLGRYSPED